MTKTLKIEATATIKKHLPICIEPSYPVYMAQPNTDPNVNDFRALQMPNQIQPSPGPEGMQIPVGDQPAFPGLWKAVKHVLNGRNVYGESDVQPQGPIDMGVGRNQFGK